MVNDQWILECTATNATATSTVLNSSTITIVVAASSASAASSIPEFEDYAILFILVTVISGFMVMKRKERNPVLG